MFIKNFRQGLILFILVGLLSIPFVVTDARADRLNQIPTGSIPTVTGSPITAYVIVLDNEQGFANVRSGPGTLGYEIVGVLVEGQQVPALGRTVVGDWILVVYPGVQGGTAWVWKDLVEVQGTLPIIEPPPTITPRVTPTLDPTLAAQFQVEQAPAKLPTFTPPPPLVIPTYVPESSQSVTGRVPVGFLIIGFAVLGLFAFLVSLFRGR
jgi:hypothetical protein